MIRRISPRHKGKLAAYILDRLWRMKLKADGFDDIENERRDLLLRADHAMELVERDPLDAQVRTEFYRRIGAEAWRFRGDDRLIALAVSEGKDVRTIKAELKVGQCRIERVICSIVGERKPPWYRRPETRAKRREKSRQAILISHSG